MVITVTSHKLLKNTIVKVLFASTRLLGLTSKDNTGNESIYEGWHPPEQIKVVYPYLTYRVNWYPRNPIGFLSGTFTIDVWDTSPNGNDTRRVEEICTTLSLLLDGAIAIDGLALVRSRLTADEWIEDELGRIHRQVVFDLRTIDLFS